jgi:S1-C subfamily serine protease
VAFIETPSGSGSGVLIEGGYVVTNAHVVWPFDEVRVVFPNGADFTAAPVKSIDVLGDLAVIGPIDFSDPGKLQTPDLPRPVSIATSNSLAGGIHERRGPGCR